MRVRVGIDFCARPVAVWALLISLPACSPTARRTIDEEDRDAGREADAGSQPSCADTPDVSAELAMSPRVEGRLYAGERVTLRGRCGAGDAPCAGSMHFEIQEPAGASQMMAGSELSYAFESAGEGRVRFVCESADGVSSRAELTLTVRPEPFIAFTGVETFDGLSSAISEVRYARLGQLGMSTRISPEPGSASATVQGLQYDATGKRLLVGGMLFRSAPDLGVLESCRSGGCADTGQTYQPLLAIDPGCRPSFDALPSVTLATLQPNSETLYTVHACSDAVWLRSVDLSAGAPGREVFKWSNTDSARVVAGGTGLLTGQGTLLAALHPERTPIELPFDAWAVLSTVSPDGRYVGARNQVVDLVASLEGAKLVTRAVPSGYEGFDRWNATTHHALLLAQGAGGGEVWAERWDGTRREKIGETPSHRSTCGDWAVLRGEAETRLLRLERGASSDIAESIRLPAMPANPAFDSACTRMAYVEGSYQVRDLASGATVPLVEAGALTFSSRGSFVLASYKDAQGNYTGFALHALKDAPYRVERVALTLDGALLATKPSERTDDRLRVDAIWFSPDEKSLFVSTNLGSALGYALYRVRLPGSVLEKVAEGLGPNIAYAFSPDNAYMAWAAQQTDDTPANRVRELELSSGRIAWQSELGAIPTWGQVHRPLQATAGTAAVSFMYSTIAGGGGSFYTADLREGALLAPGQPVPEAVPEPLPPDPIEPAPGPLARLSQTSTPRGGCEYSLSDPATGRALPFVAPPGGRGLPCRSWARSANGRYVVVAVSRLHVIDTYTATSYELRDFTPPEWATVTEPMQLWSLTADTAILCFTSCGTVDLRRGVWLASGPQEVRAVDAANKRVFTCASVEFASLLHEYALETGELSLVRDEQGATVPCEDEYQLSPQRRWLIGKSSLFQIERKQRVLVDGPVKLDPEERFALGEQAGRYVVWPLDPPGPALAVHELNYAPLGPPAGAAEWVAPAP